MLAEKVDELQAGTPTAACYCMPWQNTGNDAMQSPAKDRADYNCTTDNPTFMRAGVISRYKQWELS